MELAYIKTVKDYIGRDSNDLRKRIHIIVAEYKDTEGNTYRKAFQTPAKSGKTIVIPARGTSSELNAQRYQ